MTLIIPDLYDFLRGPGFALSILVFTSGFMYRTFMLVRATRKIKRNSIGMENYNGTGSKTEENSIFKKPITHLYIRLKNTIFGTNPVMGIISLVFHILLFIIPVFLSAHNIIADLTAGFSLPSLPERLSDNLTITLMVIGGLFLARRLFIPRVRIISTAKDYLMLIIVLAPFISGFLAYHHFFNYRVVIFMHMIIGELAIMALPFSGLVHMPFIIFSRFFIDSEYSIAHGKRRW